jgi:hypothetical protein
MMHPRKENKVRGAVVTSSLFLRSTTSVYSITGISVYGQLRCSMHHATWHDDVFLRKKETTTFSLLEPYILGNRVIWRLQLRASRTTIYVSIGEPAV